MSYSQAQAATQSELEQCRALSLVPDEIHNCLDNFLDAYDEEMALLEQKVLTQLGTTTSDATITFSIAQQTFKTFRRDNCLWYQAFSEPAVEADQIAVSCLIDMSRARLKELRSLLHEDAGAKQFHGYYLYGDDRNSFVMCGDIDRYWIAGRTESIQELQRSYINQANADNLLLYVVLGGTADLDADTQAHPGHVGIFNLDSVIEARVPRQSDCQLGKPEKRDETLIADVKVPSPEVNWHEVTALAEQSENPLMLPSEVGPAAADSPARRADTSAAADTAEAVQPEKTPQASATVKEPATVATVEQKVSNPSPEPQPESGALETEIALAEPSAALVPLTTLTTAATNTEATDQSASNSSSITTMFNDEFTGEALIAYFGAWSVDCRNDGTQAICALSVNLEGQDQAEILQPRIKLFRRTGERTVIDAVFPGQEIDSVEKILWQIDSVKFGAIEGSRLLIDDAAARQEIRQRTRIQKDLLPPMISGYEIGLTVLDASGQQTRYKGTLLGITRALKFADDFISAPSESG